LIELLERQRAWIPLLLRLAVGATFVVHGYDKVFGGDLPGTAQKLASMVGLPTLFGYVAVLAEFFCGAGLVLGLATRGCALMLAGVAAGTIYFHAVKMGQSFKASGGEGWEWQALLAASCLTLVVLGGGIVSIDALVRRKKGS
jgi:putative oxidoreductase